MKKYKMVIQYITVNDKVEGQAVNEVNFETYAEDRSSAILKGCDVGQSIARSTNGIPDKHIFYRILNVNEIGA